MGQVEKLEDSSRYQSNNYFCFYHSMHKPGTHQIHSSWSRYKWLSWIQWHLRFKQMPSWTYTHRVWKKTWKTCVILCQHGHFQSRALCGYIWDMSPKTLNIPCDANWRNPVIYHLICNTELSKLWCHIKSATGISLNSQFYSESFWEATAFSSHRNSSWKYISNNISNFPLEMSQVDLWSDLKDTKLFCQISN